MNAILPRSSLQIIISIGKPTPGTAWGCWLLLLLLLNPPLISPLYCRDQVRLCSYALLMSVFLSSLLSFSPPYCLSLLLIVFLSSLLSFSPPYRRIHQKFYLGVCGCWIGNYTPTPRVYQAGRILPGCLELARGLCTSRKPGHSSSLPNVSTWGSMVAG